MGTSKLQEAVGRMLYETFPGLGIRENCRPRWLLSSNLTRLELDFYIEGLDIAIEVQGAQHSRYIPHFHGDYSGFEKRLQYDTEKVDLCRGAGIRLVEIYTTLDAILFIDELKCNPAIELPANRTEDGQNKIKKRWIKHGVRWSWTKAYLDAMKANGMPECKIDEIKKFENKLRAFMKKGRAASGMPFRFEFHYLNYDEQAEFLKAIDIQGVVNYCAAP